MNEDDAKPDWAQDNYDPTEPENYSRFVTPLYTELQDFLEKIGHNPWKDDEGKDITDSSVEPGTPPSETAVAPRLDEAPPPSETAVKPYLLTTPPPSDTASVARPTQPSPSSTTPSDKPAPSTTPAPTQRPATTTPRPVTPAAKAPEGGIVSKLFGGNDYQSNHRPVVENGVINWGNPDNPADFARASKVVTEMMYGGGSPSASAGRSANYISAGYYGDGTTPPVLRAIRSAESSNDPNAQNPRSSAGGLYQFTDATWGSVLRRMDPEVYGSYGDKQLSFLKKNEKLQEAAAQFHLNNDILPKLKKNNIPATAGNIYLSWFQGPEGAVRAYNAPDNALVAQVFPATVKPNAPMKLDGKPYAEWTMRDLRTFTDRAMARRMRAEGGRTSLLQDQFPTHYLPDVGRQVMNSGGTPEDDAVRLAYQITTDPMGNPTVAQAQEQPEGKREGLYERAVDVMSAPFRTYAEKTKEAAEHGSHLMSESGKSLRMEDGRLPINAVPLYTMGALGTLFSPLTGAAETIGEGVKQMTGNPEAGNRAAFVAGMIDPSHAGAFAKAGTLAMVPMAGKAAEAVNIAKRELSPLGLYSHGEEMARSLPQEKGTPEQFAGMLAGSKYGVKPAELEGFREAFADKPQITREEAAQYFRQNMPQIEEKVYGVSSPNAAEAEKAFTDYSNELAAKYNLNPEENLAMYGRYKKMDPAEVAKYEELQSAWLKTQTSPTKYESYTLPGGENYRELVLKVPEVKNNPMNNGKSNATVSFEQNMMEKYGGDTFSSIYNKLNGNEIDKYEMLVRDDRNSSKTNSVLENRRNNFISGHWEDPNVIAHMRLSDRIIPSEGFAVRNKRSGNSSDTFATQQQAEEYISRLPASMQSDMAIVPAPGKPQKVLHVEELQSDWAQKGRKEGFALSQEQYDAVMEKAMNARNNMIKYYESLPAEHSVDRATIEYDLNRMINDLPPLYINDKGPAAPLVDEMRKSYYDVKKAESSVPLNPYVTNTAAWTDLALKRVLNEAAKGDYDKIVWTPGNEQAKRYDLSKQINRVTYDPNEQILAAYDHNGRQVMHEYGVEPHKIEDYIGKEPAEKLRREADNMTSTFDEYSISKDPEGGWNIDLYGEPLYDYNGEMMVFSSKSEARDYLREMVDADIASHTPEISGLDLQVGGEGMKGYYDKIVPTQLQKLVKKLDPEAKIGRETLSGTRSKDELAAETFGEGQTYRHLPSEFKRQIDEMFMEEGVQVPSLTITPKMRENILKGLTAYADGGAVDDNQAVNHALEMTRHFGSHI